MQAACDRRSNAQGGRFPASTRTGGFLTRRLSGQAQGGSSQVGCDRRSNAARRAPRQKT